MSIPKEPRQMMINMMYLVLTALLAMNVSAEILNAFHVVNQGINNSNISVNSKNDKSMKFFKDQLEIQKAKAEPFYNKAALAKKYVDELCSMISGIMDEVVEGSGGWIDKNEQKQMKGWKPELGHLSDDKNLDVSTRLMLEEGKKADILKKAIVDTRAKLLALIDKPEDKKNFESQMPLNIMENIKGQEGETKTWEEANFHMVPTIACLTLLNKFQNDAKNSEAQVIDYLLSQINALDIKVDRMVAKVIAPSSYIMSGQEYKADIFVAAYNSTSDPTILIGALNSNAVKEGDGPDAAYKETKVNPVNGGGNKLELIENGMGKYKTMASGEGEQKYSGAVMITGPDGSPLYYPFEAAYTTAKGSCVIAPDNLNLIYAGIPNPFSISVPGFSADKLTASASAGSFTGSKGKYVANMPASMVNSKVKITVTVKDQDKTTQVGASEFVIKRIPDPVAQIGGKSEGDMKTGEIRVVQGIGAVLKDFYFEGVRFDVVSYECVYIAKRQDAKIAPMTGAKFNGAVADYLKTCKPGDQFIFRKVRAKGPDGTVRSINSIPIEIR